MKKERKLTDEEMNKLKSEAVLIYDLYDKLGIYPYEMYTLLSSYAINENLPFSMDDYVKISNMINYGR